MYVMHCVFMQMCKAHRATANTSRADHAMVTAVAIHVQDHATGWRHFTVCAGVARGTDAHLIPASALQWAAQQAG